MEKCHTKYAKVVDLCVPVVGEEVSDEAVDVVECTHLLLAVLYCHGDEADVTVWGLSMGVTPPVTTVTTNIYSC